MRIALLIHLLGTIIWIGGMFFAYVALRPAAARLLEPPQRLPLWRETLGRFFVWVWISIAAIYASGFHMIAAAYGLKYSPPYVVAMFGIATVMTVIFMYIYFWPFKHLCRNVESSSWKQAGAALNRVRQLVAVNLLLGIATVVVAVTGGLLA